MRVYYCVFKSVIFFNTRVKCFISIPLLAGLYACAYSWLSLKCAYVFISILLSSCAQEMAHMSICAQMHSSSHVHTCLSRGPFSSVRDVNTDCWKAIILISEEKMWRKAAHTASAPHRLFTKALWGTMGRGVWELKQHWCVVLLQ